MNTITVKKTPIKKSLSMSNKESPEIMAYVMFIKNVTSQLLTNLLFDTEYQHANEKSKKFTTRRRKLFRRWNPALNSQTSMEFRNKANDLVDQRNIAIHPPQHILNENAAAAMYLIEQYKLQTICSFEFTTLTHFQTKR
jgi:hypothetical protein